MFRHRIFGLPTVIRFVLSFGIVFLVKLTTGGATDGRPSELLGIPGLYQMVVSDIIGSPSMSNTAVIEIDPGEMNGRFSTNAVCSQRLFIAELVRTLVETQQHPKIIAIDKHFGKTSCEESEADRSNTQSLQEAFTAASLKNVTVVVGLRLDESVAPSRYGNRVARPLVDYKDFEHVARGVFNVAGNVRQAPLLFLGVPSGSETANEMYSFAWQIVHARQPKDMAKLKESLPNMDETAPYISFIRDAVAKSHTYSAYSVICSVAPQRAEGLGLDCSEVKQEKDFPKNVDQRIVIIGERSEHDMHQSPIGRIYGYFLHANYVEALLARRYVFPASNWVNFLVGIAIFLGLEASFFFLERRQWWALIAGLVGSFLLAFIVEYLLVHLFQYLLLPFMTFGAAMGQFVERMCERLLGSFFGKNSAPEGAVNAEEGLL